MLPEASKPVQIYTERFWVEDISILFNRIQLIPTTNMTKPEQMNILTRLIIIATIILWFCKWQWWKEFAFISIITVIIFNYNKIGCDTTAPIREGFTVTPTFGPNDPALAQTYISPLYAEEWQVNPELRSTRTLKTGVKKTYPSSTTLFLNQKPRSYPYGQYLTSTNLLPSSEAQLAAASQSGKGMMNKSMGLTSAREFANSEFLRNDLAFRENMMTTYKRKLNRRYAQNTGYANNYVIGSPY